MRDYAKIRTSLWRSQKFRAIRESDTARLLYFYLHTCPQVNSVGCLSLPLGYVVADTGWSVQASRKAMESLLEAGLIGWNEAEELVRIVDFIHHDPPTNEKHAEALNKVAFGLPNCLEKLHVIHDLMAQRHQSRKADLEAEADRLLKGYTEPIETPYPNPNPIPDPTDSSLRSESVSIDDEFEIWYEGWPHKVGRAVAVKAFRTARKKTDLETLIAGRDRYIGQKPPDRPWCNPATWFNQERWLDQEAPAPQAQGDTSAVMTALADIKRAVVSDDDQTTTPTTDFPDIPGFLDRRH